MLNRYNSIKPSIASNMRGNSRISAALSRDLCLSLASCSGSWMLLLFAEFGKIRQALLVLGVVPLATLGGLIALFARDQTLNVATAVGFIALFGVVVQNGIILVANLNRLRETGVSLREAVSNGAFERFRPVLMTATVATIGMLPVAMATGTGSDVQRGLATVVIGGLISATLLTLFIVPTLYFSIERFFAGPRNTDAGTATGALKGSLKTSEFRTDAYFGFAVPTTVPGIETKLLDPERTWADRNAFGQTARNLVSMFQKNFAKFQDADAEVQAAAPVTHLAAE